MDVWLRNRGKEAADVNAYSATLDGMKDFYRNVVLPVETQHSFHHFYGQPLAEADIVAVPMVLLLGQYSSGKTTFIRHLLGRDYPGLRIGPEPTTDKFVVISHGPRDQVIPGAALALDPAMPFTQLDHFGSSFFNHLECVRLSSPSLEGFTLIDTPGVLAGAAPNKRRSYDFESVTRWFASRADCILVLFDVSNIDLSDEFGRLIEGLGPMARKVDIVLNKADGLEIPHLMRVYASLAWSLSKRLDTPELPRIFLGSYWDRPLKSTALRSVFEADENDLFTTLALLPANASVARINDLLKRARLAKVHAYLMNAFAHRMPTTGLGKDREIMKMCDRMASIFEGVAKSANIPPGDFPDRHIVARMLPKLEARKITRMHKPMVLALVECIQHDMPPLLRRILDHMPEDAAELTQVGAQASPFAVMKTGGQNEKTHQRDLWFRAPKVEECRAQFQHLGPDDEGKITGRQAREVFADSMLPAPVLHQVWTLADADKDGKLDYFEYALAQHLIKMKLDNHDLPQTLPAALM